MARKIIILASCSSRTKGESDSSAAQPGYRGIPDTHWGVPDTQAVPNTHVPMGNSGSRHPWSGARHPGSQRGARHPGSHGQTPSRREMFSVQTRFGNRSSSNGFRTRCSRNPRRLAFGVSRRPRVSGDLSARPAPVGNPRAEQGMLPANQTVGRTATRREMVGVSQLPSLVLTFDGGVRLLEP
jgi:hypothetical protein